MQSFRRFWYAYLIIALVALWLILEQLVRWVAVDVIKDLGIENAAIESVNINPFLGRVTIQDVSMGMSSSEPFRLGEAFVDIKLTELFKKRVLIEKLTLSGLKIPAAIVEDNSITIAGISPQQFEQQPQQDEQPSEPSSWQIGLTELVLNNSQLLLQKADQTHEFEISEFATRDLYFWSPQAETQLTLNSTLNDSPISLNGKAVVLTPQKTASLHLIIEQLDLAKLIALADLPYPIKQLVFSQDSSIQLALDEKNQATVNVEGSTALNNALLEENETRLKLDAFRWDGSVSLSTQDINNSINVNGKTQLNGLTLIDNKAQFIHSSINEILISSLAVNGFENIELNGIQLNQLLVGKSEKALLKKPAYDAEFQLQSLDQLEIDRVRLLKDKPLTLGNIVITDSSNTLVLDNEKTLPLLTQWQATTKTVSQWFANKQNVAASQQSTEPAKNTADLEAENVETENVEATPLPVFESIRLDKKQVLTVYDQSVKPALAMQVILDTLNVKAIPENAHEYSVEIKGTMLPQGEMTVTGLLTLSTAPKFVGDLILDSVDIVPFSPYLKEPTGYVVSTGLFNTKTHIDYNANTIAIDNAFFLEKLKLIPEKEKQIEAMAAKISMPLDFALNLIRDGDDNIKLDVPISGPTNEIEVGLTPILNQVMTKAVKHAAVYYLKQTLQPYGTLVTLGGFASNVLKGISLQPVNHLAGQVEADDNSADYLAKLADMLNKKQQLKLSLCSMVTAADVKALFPQLAEAPSEEQKQQLFGLGEQRAASLKNTLIAQYAVAKTQFINCRPQLELKSSKTPRTQLSM